MVFKFWKFSEKAWNIGVPEPKKVIHDLKVGVALTKVSLFCYMRPVYEGVGAWRESNLAVMTVVDVFEYTVGATLSKCINIEIGAFHAGSLGLGVHRIASQSGDKLEPIILGISEFLLASAATFSRFMPSVKARFDYGAPDLHPHLQLGFSFRVSGKDIDLKHQRLSTIAIETSLCILLSMVFCPIWAGDELQSLVHRNREKLADSLDGCVAGYLTSNSGEDSSKKMEGCKCALNSKTTEDSLESHQSLIQGQFCKMGNLYMVVSNSSIPGSSNSVLGPHCVAAHTAPEYLKQDLSVAGCMPDLEFPLQELAHAVKTMRKSPKIVFSVEEMQFATEQLQNTVKSLPNLHLSSNPSPVDPDPKAEVITKATLPPLIEVLPLEVVSQLMDAAARIEEIVGVVNELATLADFGPS